MRNPKDIIIDGRSLYEILLEHADCPRCMRRKRKYARLDNLDLHDVDFGGFDMMGISLKDANLQGVNFSFVDLNNSTLDGANLTGAVFYNTQMDSWSIKKVKCDFIFLDQNKSKRKPQADNFKPGEFENIFQDQSIR